MEGQINDEYRVFEFTRKISERGQFSRYLNELGLIGSAVEVGVNRGHNSMTFIRFWKGQRLYLVDPWRYIAEYKDAVNEPDEHRESTYQEVLAKFHNYMDRVTILRMSSEEAAEAVPDELDYVYIDADHSYESCYNDIRLWWPKIKRGGMMAGHDVFFPGVIGVTNALIRFAVETGLQITVIPATFIDRVQVEAHSWFVMKP